MYRRLWWQTLTRVLVVVAVVWATNAEAVGASAAVTSSRVISMCGTEYPLQGMNVHRGNDSMVGYTRTARQKSSPANRWGAEVAVTGGRVTAIRDRRVTGAGALTIPAGGYVLSAHGRARQWLLAKARAGCRVGILSAARAKPSASAPSTSTPTPSPTTVTGPAALPDKVVGEYWRTDGSPRLTTASSDVNVFYLAFAKSAASGTGRLYFAPDEGGGVTRAQLVADIAAVQARGARVILSIGGSVDGGIVMQTDAQVTELVDSVNAICDVYACNGIDWDLEHSGSGANLASLVSASARLKAARGASFAVTASVEPGLALYEQFALASGSASQGGHTYAGPVCDLYSPQFYDYAQSDTERIAGIVSNAKRMVSLGLPATRYAIGTTYAGSALGDAGQMPTTEYLQAYSTLRSQGVTIRGAFVWDMTKDARNAYLFAGVFAPALAG
jgi:hypothetical protein